MADHDAGALAELYDRYARPVYSYLHRICGDPQSRRSSFRRCSSGHGGRPARSTARGGVRVLGHEHRAQHGDRRGPAGQPTAAPGTDDPERALSLIVDRAAAPDEMGWLGDLRRQMRRPVDEIPRPQRDVIELALLLRAHPARDQPALSASRWARSRPDNRLGLLRAP
jgi:DNA-directed RNA polymerase specialized sigma24 family protein